MFHMIKYLTEVFEATNLLLVNKGGYCCQYKKKRRRLEEKVRQSNTLILNARRMLNAFSR